MTSNRGAEAWESPFFLDASEARAGDPAAREMIPVLSEVEGPFLLPENGELYPGPSPATFPLGEEEVNRSSSDYLRWVQRSLNALLPARLTVDGISGPLTRAAVRDFQTRHRLAVDGIVGPDTEAALIRAGATRPPEASTGPAPPGGGTTAAVNTPLPADGVGFYSYTSAEKRFGLVPAIAATVSVGRTWNRAHPGGPRLGIGDISVRGGGAFQGHSTHREGRNVDIRPVRGDGKEDRVSYTESGYSRTLTQELVDLLRGNDVLGVSSILFNDPRVTGVRPYTGHDDHLHVEFEQPPAAAPPAPGVPGSTPPPQGVRGSIVRLARGEWERWQRGALDESNPAAFPILVDYWQLGVGSSPSEAASKAKGTAWSAAFICWVLRKAGITGSQFQFASAHSDYIAAAYQNQLSGRSGGFKTYRADQRAPHPGDSVCTTYESSNTPRPPTNLELVRPGTLGYHSDIVVSVDTGTGVLQALGGNLSDSVGQKTLSLDSRGYLAEADYFALLSLR